MTTTIQTTNLTTGFTFANSGDTLEVLPDVSISTQNGSAVSGAGPADVEDFGFIVGEYCGIAVGGASGTSHISVGGDGLAAGGDGGAGVVVDGAFDIVNHGEITDTMTSGGGITADGGGRLVNYGAIDGNYTGIWINDATADLATIINYGSISGDIKDAFLGGTEADHIVNRGTIVGDVQLGNGGSMFNGRGGDVVDGTITGGTGADTIYLGSDGETVKGGGGHDVIYGGGGADVFEFTSFQGRDNDHIISFNPAVDTIEFYHSDFTALKAGATPAFSIGTAPTSATDHLFYNSSNGWVYYDADGTGPKASDPVVNVGAHLALKASDFKVV